MEEYLDFVKAKGRAWKRHETSLKNLKPFFGEMLLSKITLDDIIRYKLERGKENLPGKNDLRSDDQPGARLSPALVKRCREEAYHQQRQPRDQG